MECPCGVDRLPGCCGAEQDCTRAGGEGAVVAPAAAEVDHGTAAGSRAGVQCPACRDGHVVGRGHVEPVGEHGFAVAELQAVDADIALEAVVDRSDLTVQPTVSRAAVHESCAGEADRCVGQGDAPATTTAATSGSTAALGCDVADAVEGVGVEVDSASRAASCRGTAGIGSAALDPAVDGRRSTDRESYESSAVATDVGRSPSAAARSGFSGVGRLAVGDAWTADRALSTAAAVGAAAVQRTAICGVVTGSPAGRRQVIPAVATEVTTAADIDRAAGVDREVIVDGQVHEVGGCRRALVVRDSAAVLDGQTGKGMVAVDGQRDRCAAAGGTHGDVVAVIGAVAKIDEPVVRERV